MKFGGVFKLHKVQMEQYFKIKAEWEGKEESKIFLID